MLVAILICNGLLLAVSPAVRRGDSILITGTISMWAMGLLILSIGLLASFFGKRTRIAFILSYLLNAFVLFLFAGLNIAVGLMLYRMPGRVGNRAVRDNFEDWMEVVGFSSPLIAYFRNMDLVGRKYDSYLNWYWASNIIYTLLLTFIVFRVVTALYKKYGMQDR